MTLLGKEQILVAQDLPHADVEVPEWGGTVRIQAMTAMAREDIEASYLGPDGRPKKVTKGFRAHVVAGSVIGESGALLFSLEDVEALGRKSFSALNRVFQEAQRLSGLGDEQMEEIEGNSSEAQVEDSTSA